MVAKGNPGLDKVSDVNVLCGVLKDFFIKLKEALLTFKLHSTFIKATGEKESSNWNSPLYNSCAYKDTIEDSMRQSIQYTTLL